MKNILFLLAVTMSCVSCTWDEKPEIPEIIKMYCQTHNESEPKDSTGIGDNGADSTYVAHFAHHGTTKNDTVTYSPDSIRCNILVEGKLIVDGGTYSDISDTYVTVEEIVVRVWTDGKDMVTYYPEASDEVAEPAEVLGWDTMPPGVRYARRTLTNKPVTISYKDNFQAEVTVCYMLRTKETRLAADCTPDRYWNTVKCESVSNQERMCIVVPLELMTIQFDAIVEQYE